MKRAVLLMLALVLGGVTMEPWAAARGADMQAVIRATASYRERLALPPEAVFEATLEDVSRADAPADVLGRVRLASPGQVPIRFEIPYDASRIREGNRYTVISRITVGGNPWFTTDRVYPVLTGGHAARVDLMMVRVSASPAAAKVDGPGRLGDLPASFEGDLPAADGPGIRYHLDLYPDGAFVLRLSYLGREKAVPFDDVGTWSVSPDGGPLTLRGGREAPVHFAIRDEKTLRKLDQGGREIDPRLDYSLRRRETFEPVEPQLTLCGMYRYMADAGIFQECLTGWRLPVAQEGDNAALESAYSKARREPGEPLLVTLEGRIAERPRMEGPGKQQVLVPERFINLWPGETCGPRHSKATLENTCWKLTRLGGKPAETGAGGREISLTLASKDRRARGFSGCNRFAGGYDFDGKRLAFKQVAATRMACGEGMEQEAAFLKALGATASWEITGEHLELYDAGGAMLLRFESRHMK